MVTKRLQLTPNPAAPSQKIEKKNKHNENYTQILFLPLLPIGFVMAKFGSGIVSVNTMAADVLVT